MIPAGAVQALRPDDYMVTTYRCLHDVIAKGIPIANGLALAAKLRGTGQVAIVSFGDGATSIGTAHEAFNMGALWDLSVIYLLQNNQYGEHTAIAGYTKTRRFSDRASGYGCAV